MDLHRDIIHFHEWLSLLKDKIPIGLFDLTFSLRTNKMIYFAHICYNADVRASERRRLISISSDNTAVRKQLISQETVLKRKQENF